MTSRPGEPTAEAGIGLETARKARAEGADVVLTGRDAERLQGAALDLDARSTAAFDANDPASLKRFFDGLPNPIDHVMVTAGGPHYGPLLQMDSDQVRRAMSEHILLALEVARHAVGKVRPGGNSSRDKRTTLTERRDRSSRIGMRCRSVGTRQGRQGRHRRAGSAEARQSWRYQPASRRSA